MPRDWPHPLDPEPTPRVRRWWVVEAVVLAALIGAAVESFIANGGT